VSHPRFTIAFALRRDEILERAHEVRAAAEELQSEHRRLKALLEPDVSAHRKRRFANPS
jgi:hypothetical protein